MDVAVRKIGKERGTRSRQQRFRAVGAARKVSESFTASARACRPLELPRLYFAFMGVSWRDEAMLFAWLAVDAVRCELFSAGNSLLTGKNTRNFAPLLGTIRP